MNRLVFAILAIALTSCGIQRQIKKCEKCLSLIDTTSKTIYKDSVTIKHDTVIKYITVEADTTIQVLVIECDSNGKATIKTSTKEKGNRSDLSLQLKDNRLVAVSTCDKVVDSLELVISNTQKFRSEMKIPDNQTLMEAGYFFQEEDFVLPENIFYSKNGLTFHYNVYEIASYAQGAISIDFDWKEVAAFMKIK
jgi:hypothetical protein